MPRSPFNEKPGSKTNGLQHTTKLSEFYRGTLQHILYSFLEIYGHRYHYEASSVVRPYRTALMRVIDPKYAGYIGGGGGGTHKD